MTSDVRSATAFPAAIVPRIEALAERARVADEAAPFSDDMWQLVRDGRTQHAAYVTGPDESVIAAGFTGNQGQRLAGELVVHPSHRGRGYGQALVSGLLSSTPEELWLWSHNDHPGARRLAQRHNLERARELLQLRLTADELTTGDLAWPAGVQVRTFVVGRDEPAWLDVNNAAFAWHPEQGSQTLDDIRAATHAPDFDAAGFFLAFRGDALIGFHWTKVHPADPNASEPIGEVYVVGVSPDAHGSGVGTALTAQGVNYLVDERGVHTVMLYVEGDNAAALHVYERLGFRRYLTNVAYRRPALP